MVQKGKMTYKKRRMAQAKVIANMVFGLQGSDPENKVEQSGIEKAAFTLQEIVEEELTTLLKKVKALKEEELTGFASIDPSLHRDREVHNRVLDDVITLIKKQLHGEKT